MNQLIKDQNGDWLQTRDSKPIICPFRTPIPVPGQLAGQISLVSINCNSQCPFFHLVRNTDNEITHVQRSCCSLEEAHMIAVDEVIEPKNTPPPAFENKKRTISLH